MDELFEQLMREADKPTQVPESIAKYAAALVAGTHEITSLTIRPKRTWVGLTDGEVAEILCDDRWQGRPELMMLQVQAKLKDLNT